MNIFKVLSDGDGSINEPNVSSFLAYLLDPSAEHGLGSTLLCKVLEPVVLQSPDSFSEIVSSNRVTDLSYRNKRFNVVVLQELKVLYGKKYKERHIDIVVEIRGLDDSIKYSFPIENKISDGSINIKDDQLRDEYEGLRDFYKNKGENPTIGFIYLTPEPSAKSASSFEKIKTTHEESAHIYWRGGGEEDHTNVNISDLLSDILKMELVGSIDPVYEYTKHLIKSFISFTRSDFQSYVAEKLNSISRADYKKPIIEYLRDIYDSLEFGVDYNLKDIKNKLADMVLKESGTELHNTTRTCQLYLATVNEPNRRHYGASNPQDERKNLFYYSDSPENNKIRKFDPANPPQGVEIFWSVGKERQSALATEIYNNAIETLKAS